MGPQYSPKAGQQSQREQAGQQFYLQHCQNSKRRFLGALWGPVTVQPQVGFFLGATRPTIPVATLSATVQSRTTMRATEFRGPLHWGPDSLYALGIMLYAHATSTEVALVTRARAEAREATERYNLSSEHTPTHMGNPPK